MQETLAIKVLTEPEWRELENAHLQRATEFTRQHLERRTRGIKHPIEDFLFTYYSHKPSQLKKWHPGAGVLLANSAAHTAQRHYKHLTMLNTSALAKSAGTRASDIAVSGAIVDLQSFFQARSATVDYIETLLTNTLSNTPRFGCFGLHEWAMVYKLTPEQIRHRGLRLRIGHERSDLVVESNPIVCSHFDAYRFFTEPARALNEMRPTRAGQQQMEQSGCLHAGMDIYKWVTKLTPIIPGELLLDAFELARDIRILDMQASPYDVSDYGYPAVAIETPAGKREYAAAQKVFAERGNMLRRRTLEAIELARKLASR